MTHNRNRMMTAVLAVVVLIAAIVLGSGTNIVGAMGRLNDEPITGDALDRASAAALAHTGEGEVTDTEVGDEDGYYEVEVTLNDGSKVDVHLDESFNVIGEKADTEEADEADEVEDEIDEADDDGENDAADKAEDEAEGADKPITGDALDQASAAALKYIGEGRVTDTEVGDEEGYYEIEITLDNGRQVDVHLDETFNVLSEEAD